MCRLLGYLGPTASLEQLLYKPDHSLIVQSYQPRELEVALLNADGFGVGWYHSQRQTDPFNYRSTLPIWNDANLPHLSRYIESNCVLAYIRSATPGLAIDLSNCQPFQQGALTFIHNGFIENFRQTMYRPLRDRLCDTAYHAIHGLTDSEHIFALVLHHLDTQPGCSLEIALHQTLVELAELSQSHSTRVAANIIVGDGDRLVAARFDTHGDGPSFYWLKHAPGMPDSALFVSEPLFEADWVPCIPQTIFSVDRALNLHQSAIAALKQS
ncbi:MAG: ergothioneine biosynthesis protein EgtC [Cyanobacteria bacterium P01_D01_bin.128]